MFKQQSFVDKLVRPCTILTPLAVIPVLVIALEVFLVLPVQHVPNGRQQQQRQLRRLTTDDLEQLDVFFEARNDLELRIRNDSKSLLDCAQISSTIRHLNQLSGGWTKTVYTAQLGNRRVAVKLVNEDGESIRRCLQQPANNVGYCRQCSVRKFVKEIVALSRFSHDSVIRLLGYCVPFDLAGRNMASLTIVSELGEPANLIQLLQLNWESRLRLFLSVVNLLDFLATHPDGPIVLNDFRMQQFVIVDGQLKLVDFDDLGLEETTCDNDQDCRLHLQNVGIVNTQRPVPCFKGLCRGSNDVKNIDKAARNFLFLIMHGALPGLQPTVDRLAGYLRNQTMSSGMLRRHVLDLVDNYATGKYLDHVDLPPPLDFTEHVDTDLPQLYDYPCKDSSSTTSCTLTVANLDEAKRLCSLHTDCGAFVWTGQTSWTGRTLVKFKNQFGSPSRAHGLRTYAKDA